jgi:hypothetical protein
MVELFYLIVAALKTIPGMTVIETSLASTEKNYPLPATVIDFEPTQFEPFLEDQSKVNMTPAYSLVIHVPINNKDKSIERKMVLDYYKQILAKIAELRYAFIIRDAVVDYMPFGVDQQVFGLGFLVRFQNVSYDLT